MLGILCIASATLVAGCGGSDKDESVSVALTVDSSDPQWVSGGDALLRVKADIAEGRSLRVRVNGAVAPITWSTDPVDATTRIGLVSGLSLGQNTVVADVIAPSVNDPLGSATLQVRNFPRTGPMFSGPHETPFICQTEAFRLYSGGPMLGPATDANCSAVTRVDYVYRTTAGAFAALPSVTALPQNMATATTTDGRTVPYVVRIETGTANRSIYQTAVLHNPVSQAVPTPARRSEGWNGRLVYTFGGGCPGGWYRQGSNTGGVLDDGILKQGYAMASASLNVFGNNCSDVVAAETVAMVKERFVEAYGRPQHTIGWGCSGGSYQQLQTVENYPGLLDGIIPGCSFPEVMFATTHFMTDARLLGHYFRDIAPGSFSAEQQRAVAGVLGEQNMYASITYDGALRIASIDSNCPTGLAASLRYNALGNRGGVRCNVYDHMVNVFGKDPQTGFARRPLDNTGIQYGLEALNGGQISVDQFLSLNAAIGGYDADGGFQAPRTVADAQAVRTAYRTGRLTSGSGGLKEVPIIDFRAYGDDAAIGDVHVRYHSFSMRDRLVKANGNADNFVMLIEDMRYPQGGYVSASPLLMKALSEIDKWLTAMAADTGAGSKREKVLRNKPSTLQEGCNTRDATPRFIAEKMERSSGQCAAIYPSPAGPRVAAGESLAGDIIKCQLKPVTQTDYRVAMTTPQLARLNAIFPTGTCNWAVAGVEQQPLAGIWQSY